MMKWVSKLMLLFVIFLLPLVVLTLSVNLVVRMPDFYQYEFNRKDTATELRLGMKETELADVFSKYMWGKEPEFVIKTDVETEEKQDVVLPDEKKSMERFRAVVNIFSLVAALLFLPVVAGYFLLIRKGEKDSLRKAYLLSIPALLAYSGLFGFCVLTDNLAETLQNGLMGPAFPQQGILQAVFTPEFLQHSLVASGSIAIITYIILGMVTWNITKPYRMFSGRRDRPDRQ